MEVKVKVNKDVKKLKKFGLKIPKGMVKLPIFLVEQSS